MEDKVLCPLPGAKEKRERGLRFTVHVQRESEVRIP